MGALQILLDKGQEDDWFGSQFITTLAVVAVVCLVSLVIWEWFAKAPIIDVQMFKNFNFASSNLMMFMLGVMLFSQPGDDAAISADAFGIYLSVGRFGAFRGRVGTAA